MYMHYLPQIWCNKNVIDVTAHVKLQVMFYGNASIQMTEANASTERHCLPTRAVDGPVELHLVAFRTISHSWSMTFWLMLQSINVLYRYNYI